MPACFPKAARKRVFVDRDLGDESIVGYLEVEWVVNDFVSRIEKGQAFLRFIPPDEAYQARTFRFPVDDLVFVDTE